jgi:RNA polymerase sigma-70 factor, ECF subfamily
MNGIPPASSATAGSTSSSLLARVQARDPDAWRRFVDLYGPLVYRWTRAAGVTASESLDVAQEVFSSVAGHVGQLRHGSHGDTFRGWLWTVTRNKSRDHFRKLGRRPEAVGGNELQDKLFDVPQPEASDADEAEITESRNFVLARAVELVRGEFEITTWQAFWRTTVDGHNPADVGRELGLSPGAVRQGKYRVLRRLRQEMDA